MGFEVLEEIGLDRIRELFNYDEKTGIFTNRLRRPGVMQGKITGQAKHHTGSLLIGIDGNVVATHSAAYFYMTGIASKVRHKNGIRDDNRFENLIGFIEDCYVPEFCSKNDIQEYFSYSDITGYFYYKTNTRNFDEGDIACRENSQGYNTININGRTYLSHRLAWLWLYSETIQEDLVIDHINGDRTDNRKENLRLVTYSENNRNINNETQCNNTSGCKGVQYSKSTGVYSASITIDKESIYLGSFKTYEEAVDVRKEAEIEYDFYL